MADVLGEYICKVDAKGRVKMPAALIKQLPENQGDVFVANRGLEKCLNLFPLVEWKRIKQGVDELNLYDSKQRAFARHFYRGASRLNIDSNVRILIPKTLMEYAGLKREVVLYAYSDRIEIWDHEEFEKMLDDTPEDFAQLAQEVMVNVPSKGSEG